MRQGFAVLFLLWTYAPALLADTACEVQRLLGFIGSSPCTFVRNGEKRGAADAKAHIERKYDYAKRWIETAEQFIEYAATKSSATGEPYSVICSGRKEPSADWLKRELARLRASSTCPSER